MSEISHSRDDSSRSDHPPEHKAEQQTYHSEGKGEEARSSPTPGSARFDVIALMQDGSATLARRGTGDSLPVGDPQSIDFNQADSRVAMKLDSNGNPTDVTNDDGKGNKTHITFDSDGAPKLVEQTGKNPSNELTFNTPDGRNFHFDELNVGWSGMYTNLTVTQKLGANEFLTARSHQTSDGWQNDSLQHDLPNGSIDMTRYNGAAGPGFLERITRNSDGGFNAHFSNLDGSPSDIKQDFRMMPDGPTRDVYTYMKTNGTRDRQVVVARPPQGMTEEIASK